MVIMLHKFIFKFTEYEYTHRIDDTLFEKQSWAVCIINKQLILDGLIRAIPQLIESNQLM